MFVVFFDFLFANSKTIHLNKQHLHKQSYASGYAGLQSEAKTQDCFECFIFLCIFLYMLNSMSLHLRNPYEAAHPIAPLPTR